MRQRDEHKELAIRQKALQIMVKQGLDGFSMQKLAKAANVSPATIYIYFKDKEDLIIRLCEEAGEKMVNVTMKNFEPSMSFSEGLKSAVVEQDEVLYEISGSNAFLEQLRHSPYSNTLTEVIGDKFKKSMGNFVSNAIKKGELVKVPVEVYWSIAFAPLYNLVKFHLTGKSLAGRKFVLTNKVILNTLELVVKALTP